MEVAKRFRWEAAHRLPCHKGGCENLHGHSYRMLVKLTGPADEHGMVIDFKEIKSVLEPLVDAWDHATLVAGYDKTLLEAISLLASKHYVFPFDTTSENMCQYVCDYLGSHAMTLLDQFSISAISVRIEETETCYAELYQEVTQLKTHVAATSSGTVLKNSV